MSILIEYIKRFLIIRKLKNSIRHLFQLMVMRLEPLKIVNPPRKVNLRNLKRNLVPINQIIHLRILKVRTIIILFRLDLVNLNRSLYLKMPQMGSKMMYNKMIRINNNRINKKLRRE